MKQVRTNNNVRFDSPLSEQLNIRLTREEKSQIDVISRENYISQTELIRNLIRENIHKYCMSEELKRNLHISNEIDKMTLEFRLISSRNESNYSKTHQILDIFEAFCQDNPKKIDELAYKSRVSAILYLTKLIYEEDIFLSRQIEPQLMRIWKMKAVKYWNATLGISLDN